MKKTITILLALAMGFLVMAGTSKYIKKQPAKPPIKKEKVTFKKFKENDPKSKTDNTIVVMRENEEVELPVHSDLSESRLNPFRDQPVNITATYTPETGDYTVTNVEPFAGY